MDPQQELFTCLLSEIRKRGYDVYDGGLPPEGAPYPLCIWRIAGRRTVPIRMLCLERCTRPSMCGTVR